MIAEPGPQNSASGHLEPCAGTNTVAALLAGAIDPGAAQRLELHLDACATCRQLVADLGRGLSAVGEAPGAPAASGVLPQLGEQVGRFTIVRVIGVGGMGVVYEARDAALERTVAVKLLRPDIVDGELLLGEAQAMARLQHANVAVVHDVGRFRGQLYVCLEYVAGSTLRGWLAERRRAWRDIVEVFVAAGRGLAYVHAAGLVHLDFKPDNVLIGRGGRVVVTDFGLARAHGHHGVAIGTPAYMAPEQRRGERTCARTDQYGFCVALREAIGARGPRWLQRVIARGVEPRVVDRFATMDALLAALAGPARRRWPRVAASTAAIAVAAVALVLAVPRTVDTITRVIERPVVRPELERVAGAAGGANEPAAAASADPVDVDDEPSDPVTAVEVEPRVIASAPSAAAASDARELAAREVPALPAAPPPALSTRADTRPLLLSTASFTGAGAADCDDGSELRCATREPACPPTTTAALQDGCWTCADSATCAALGLPRACEAAPTAACVKSAAECSGREQLAVRGGCERCVDPLACGAGGGAGAGAPAAQGSGSGASSGPGSGSSVGPGSDDANPVCGNGFCEAGETHDTCPADCCVLDASGACAAVCGNGFCELGEDHASCPADCP